MPIDHNSYVTPADYLSSDPSNKGNFPFTITIASDWDKSNFETYYVLGVAPGTASFITYGFDPSDDRTWAALVRPDGNVSAYEAIHKRAFKSPNPEFWDIAEACLRDLNTSILEVLSPYIELNKKVSGIKMLRALTGLGLTSAKEVYEHCEDKFQR
jgi:hypothetical protein